jgi:hypothetical protein
MERTLSQMVEEHDSSTVAFGDGGCNCIDCPDKINFAIVKAIEEVLAGIDEANLERKIKTNYLGDFKSG